MNGISRCGFSLTQDYFVIRPRSDKADQCRRDSPVYQAFGMQGFKQLRNPESKPPDKLPRKGANAPGELLQAFPCLR